RPPGQTRRSGRNDIGLRGSTFFMVRDFTMPLSAGRATARWATFVLCCFVIVGLFGFFQAGVSTARAQDAGDGETKAADAAPQPAGRPDSLFMHMVKSVGPVFGIMFLAISISLVALIVLLAMDLRMGMAIPPGFVEEFTDTVNKRRFK